jgi:hypothetical protein
MAFCPCTKVLSLIGKALCPYGGVGTWELALCRYCSTRQGPPCSTRPGPPCSTRPGPPCSTRPGPPCSARSSPPFNTHVTKYIHTHSHALCITNIHTMLLTRTTPRCIVQLYVHSTVYRLTNHTVHAVKFVYMSKDSTLPKPAVPEISSAL